MRIHELADKIKPFLVQDGLIILLVAATALSGYGLGRVSAAEESAPISIHGWPDIPEYQAGGVGSVDRAISGGGSGRFLASKNGTKYYLPECSGAKRISEANKIWFNSKEEAIARGYGPAANCKGL